MRTGSIYSASDKALFDAINQSAVTAADLRELFMRHGIVISNRTPRRQLAMHFARLMHGYDDFETLARIFESPQRRERSSATQVSGDVQIENFEAAAHAVVDALVHDNDAATATLQPDGTVRLHVRYRQMHFNKSEFRQVETKDAVITVEQEGNAFVIRGPQNEKVQQICQAIIVAVEESIQGKLKLDMIQLTGFPLSAQRVNFFRLLIDGIPGYERVDVTDVYLFNPEKSRHLAQADSEDVAEDEDDEDLGIHIDSASLKGGNVLESGELRNLLTRDFYISKIVWRVKEKGAFDADLVELEAQFSEPETCQGFSYLVKGYYEYDKEGFSSTRKQFDREGDRKLGKLIETSAREAMAKLSKS